MSPQPKKSDFKRGFKAWADKQAIEFRKSLGLLEHDPLCAFELCKHFKVQLLEPDDVDGLSAEQRKSLLLEGSNSWSAATVPLGNNQYLIIHNPNHSPARQQSNLMHELAHIICRHEVPISISSSEIIGILRHYDKGQEDEADWLGSCLQLPRPALLWAKKNGMTEEKISQHYNASLEMVKYRIGKTGVNKQLRLY